MGSLGLKTSLGQFRPKGFGKGLIKPLVENPNTNFQKEKPHYLKNHEMNPIKSWNFKTCLDLKTCCLETTFGPLGPRRRIQS